MNIFLDDSGSVAGFQSLLKQALATDQVEGLLILACDANGFTPESIDPILAQLSIPVIGGVFPEIIYTKEKYQKGSIVATLSSKPDLHIIKGLSDESIDFSFAVGEQIPDRKEAKTMMIFVDGLSSRIASLIEGVFIAFGLDCNYIGGGAGSLSFEQGPCLFTPEGMLEDCAIIGLLDVESGIGVQHGWENISGPYKVTQSDRTIIQKLDGQTAFEVYKEVVEKASGQVFSDDNFFAIAKGYPFGINRLGDEKIVRDPIVVNEEGGLVCVGEVPQDSYVYILKGQTTSLVFAASKARALGEYSFPEGSKAQTHLFIDCISRVLFMEDEFYRELEAVYDESTPLLGALTLGEIANFGQEFLEFYNKTAVLGVLEI
ncbi:MAG: FIST N-terminal domain-containing protein [Bacteroidota bacterium]